MRLILIYLKVKKGTEYSSAEGIFLLCSVRNLYENKCKFIISLKINEVKYICFTFKNKTRIYDQFQKRHRKYDDKTDSDNVDTDAADENKGDVMNVSRDNDDTEDSLEDLKVN